MMEAVPGEGVMDIRNVANHGNVERSGDRTKSSEARTVVIPAPARDEASISPVGRATAAAIEGLAERARGDGRNREGFVAAALERLRSGELDDAKVLTATAQRLLAAKFLSV